MTPFRPALALALLATPALADLATLTPEETAAIESGVRFDLPDAEIGPSAANRDKALGTVMVCGWATAEGEAIPFLGSLAPDGTFMMLGLGGPEGTPMHQATAASCEEMGVPLPPRT